MPFKIFWQRNCNVFFLLCLFSSKPCCCWAGFWFSVISLSPGSHLKLCLNHWCEWSCCVSHSSCIHHVVACGSIPKQTVCEHRLCLLVSIGSVKGVNVAMPFGAEQDVALTVDRAEIGRLIWCRHWDWKWLHNHTIETSYESSLKWLFGCLSVCWYIKFSANFHQMRLAKALRLT